MQVPAEPEQEEQEEQDQAVVEEENEEGPEEVEIFNVVIDVRKGVRAILGLL